MSLGKDNKFFLKSELLGNITKYREGGASAQWYVDNLGQKLAIYSTQVKSGQWPVL